MSVQANVLSAVHGWADSHKNQATKENSQNCWDVWHAFILGWGDPGMSQATCQTIGKSWLPYRSACRVPIQTFRLFNTASFYACRPLLKLIWTLLSYVCLDIRLRAPDWLHFPYSQDWENVHDHTIAIWPERTPSSEQERQPCFPDCFSDLLFKIH